MNRPTRPFGLDADSLKKISSANEARIRSALELADRRYRERTIIRKAPRRGLIFYVLRLLTPWR